MDRGGFGVREGGEELRYDRGGFEEFEIPVCVGGGGGGGVRGGSLGDGGEDEPFSEFEFGSLVFVDTEWAGEH